MNEHKNYTKLYAILIQEYIHIQCSFTWGELYFLLARKADESVCVIKSLLSETIFNLITNYATLPGLHFFKIALHYANINLCVWLTLFGQMLCKLSQNSLQKIDRAFDLNSMTNWLILEILCILKH